MSATRNHARIGMCGGEVESLRVVGEEESEVVAVWSGGSYTIIYSKNEDAFLGTKHRNICDGNDDGHIRRQKQSSLKQG